jgi:hypothetical protein
MRSDRDRLVGALAMAIGVVGIVSVVSLAVFFAVGGPFGSINDWTIGIVGGLTAALCLLVPGSVIGRSIPGGIGTTGLGVAGAVIVMIGAALVITATTGFLLAGLVESVGFALVGAWLVAVARSMRRDAVPTAGGLAILGQVAGWLMAIGIFALPGVILRLDDLETAPWWVWVAFVGWLGIFVAYPAWCLWTGRTLRRAGTSA